MTDVVFGGDLNSRSASLVFLKVAEDKATGTLALSLGEERLIFIFRNGLCVGSKSLDKEEATLSLLLQQRWVDENLLREKWDELQKIPAAKHSEALVALGLTTASQLIQVLELQVKIRMQRVLNWKEGKYVLLRQIPPQFDQSLIQLEIERLLFHACVEAWKPGVEILSQKVPRKGDLSDSLVAKLQLPSELLGLLGRADGNLSFVQLLGETKLKANLAKIYTLKTLGVLDWSDVLAIEREEQRKLNFEEIQSVWQSFQGKDYFKVLGVKESASDAEIKEAYFKLARLYHPDRVATESSPELKKKVESVFGLISLANNTLSTAKARASYQEQRRAPVETVTQTSSNIMEAEVQFQKGLAMVRKGDFAKALVALKAALGLYDQEPEYLLLYGWALFREGVRSKQEALCGEGRLAVAKALEANDKLGEGFYYLGMIERHQNNWIKAKAALERAVRLLPYHSEAKSELRFIQARLAKEDESKKKPFWKK